MARNWPALRRLAAASALALIALPGLSGCMKMMFDFTVNADDTISATTIIACEDSILEQAAQDEGQTVEEFLAASGFEERLAAAPGLAEQFTVDDYAADGHTGWIIAGVEPQPLGALAPPGLIGQQPTLDLRREGDEFILSGVIDMAGFTAGAAAFTGGDPEAEQMLAELDIRWVFAFPGPVKSANGLIDANTVTFTPQWDQRLEVEAVASATGPGGGEPAASSGGPGGLPAWAALALAGGVLLAAAAAGRVAAIRRKRAAGAAGDPDPLSPAGGFGPLPAAHGSASPTRPAQDPRP